MALTSAQQAALKADILADPVLAAYPDDSDGAFAIAAAYDLPAVPDYWVWRTMVTEHEITDEVSPESTTWSWVAYIARNPGEHNGWARMFNSSETINPSLPQVRQGMADIFSGGTGSAQRAHLLAVAKRKATRVEKLFATGTGVQATPSTMTFEGSLTYADVLDARRS